MICFLVLLFSVVSSINAMEQKIPIMHSSRVPSLQTQCVGTIKQNLAHNAYDSLAIKALAEYTCEYKPELQSYCLAALYTKACKKANFKQRISWFEKLQLSDELLTLLSHYIAHNSSQLYPLFVRLSSNKPIGELKGHDTFVNDLSCFTDGKKCASCSADGTLKIWDLEKKECLTTIVKDKDITSLAIFPDQTKIIYATRQPLTIYCKNLITDEEVTLLDNELELKSSDPFFKQRFLSTDSIHQCTVSSQGILAFCSYKFIMYLFDTKTDTTLYTDQYPKKKSHNFDSKLIFFPDENKIAYSCDHDISIKQLSGKHVRTLRGHSRLITALALTSDGNTLISGDNHITIIIWNIREGTALHTVSHCCYVSSLKILPHGQLFLDSSGCIRSCATGSSFKEHGFVVPSSDLTLTPCGRKIISQGYQTLYIYSIVDEELMSEVKNPLVWLLLEELIQNANQETNIELLKNYNDYFQKLPQKIKEIAVQYSNQNRMN